MSVAKTPARISRGLGRMGTLRRQRLSRAGAAQLLEVISPYETTLALRSVLEAISAELLVAALLTAALIWAAHSNVAVDV